MGPRHPASSRHASGFTLVEIVVVLLIVSVLIAMAAVMTRGVVAAQKRSMTATRLATVEAALLQFVAQQKRLPCPADGTLPSSHNNAGLEVGWSAAGCTGNQQNGVVPWRALALTEVEASDAWDRRLTYRVGPLLAATNGMDMSQCDPAGSANATGGTSACVAGCVSTAIAACTTPANFLTNNFGATGKGLQIRNIAGAVLMQPNVAAPTAHTGAAYVVISAGESGGGAYLSSGTLAVSTTGDGLEEQKNYASLPFVNNTVTYYVDDSTNGVVGDLHFDDLLLHPSVLMVATKAGLGPRTH